jgi:hypothetical protein
MTIVLAIAALLAVTGGCLLLALSQPRHWQAVTHTASRAPRSVRPAGWCLIGVSLILVIMRDGLGFGALSWPLLTSVGALITAAILSVKPAMLAPIAKFLTDRKGIF